ncbi:Transcriptional regulators [Cedecea neteri]|uniref:Transcriptional regulators n=1 Tax=Cedecea neteri TaxID=158822 RepID=A0A2X2T319_9ENTR|nr:Transcriptional regulators [Cedecea neteri]
MTLNKTDRIIVTLGSKSLVVNTRRAAALPAEAELCEEFETSRNIIREVFRSLMAKRLIEMKRYRGAFVQPGTSGTTSIPRCCSGCLPTITTRA